MEEYLHETEIIGAIKILKLKGEEHDSILKAIVNCFGVSEEYVNSIIDKMLNPH